MSISSHDNNQENVWENRSRGNIRASSMNAEVTELIRSKKNVRFVHLLWTGRRPKRAGDRCSLHQDHRLDYGLHLNSRR